MVYKPLLAAFLAASVAVVDGRILSGNLEKEGTVDKFKHEAPGQLLKLERPPKEDRIDDDDDDAYSVSSLDDDDTYSVSDDSTVIDEVLDSTLPVVSRKLLQIKDRQFQESIDKINVIKINEIAAEKIKMALENKDGHPWGVEKDHPCHPNNGANGDHSCADPHEHGDINQGDTAL
jgi:hypothetical protein